MRSLDENFKDDKGHFYLVRCPDPDCGLENHAMSVSSGICAWCGYNANEAQNESKSS